MVRILLVSMLCLITCGCATGALEGIEKRNRQAEEYTQLAKRARESGSPWLAKQHEEQAAKTRREAKRNSSGVLFWLDVFSKLSDSDSSNVDKKSDSVF